MNVLIEPSYLIPTTIDSGPVTRRPL